MFYVILYGLPKLSNVRLLYSFIHVFIYNSITKYYWQNFANPWQRGLEKKVKCYLKELTFFHVLKLFLF